MDPIFVKKEFEEVVNDYKGDISMKNDKPSTSAEENSSTSGLAIKQEWIVCDNSMDYNKSVVKEEPEDEEDDFYEDKQAELKFQVKNEALLDNWMDSEVQYKDIPEKIFLPEAEKDMVIRFTPTKKKQNNNMDNEKQKERQRLAMRRLREARRQDPEKYEEEKRKERLRYNARKESGKIKSVKEMEEKEKRTKRKEWREKYRKWYNKQKELKLLSASTTVENNINK